MIKITILESQFSPVIFVISESNATVLANTVNAECKRLLDKSETADRETANAIAYILNSTTAYSMSETSNFMKELKILTGYRSSHTSGNTINMRQFEIENTAFINKKYINEIAETLTETIKKFNETNI